MQKTCLKTIATILSSFLLFSCSKEKSKTTISEVPKHHVIITYLTTGNKPKDSGTAEMLEKLNERLTKLVNAELVIYYIPWNNYQTNYNLKLAEKDGSIDLIGTATDWLDAWKNASLGNFLPLSDEMIQKYAPKTWESVSKEHWDVCRLNGDIYFFPEDNYTQWTNHGFMYRMDWAKEAGMNGVHSWEDLTKYLGYVKENKNIVPWDSNGASSTFHPEGYIQSKSDFIVADGITSTNMFGTKKSNMKKFYSPIYEGKELVDYAKLMREWNLSGFWPENVLTNNTGNIDNREEFCLGLTGVEQHHTQTWYTQVYKKLQKNVPGSDSGFFWFGEESKNVVYQTITHGAMAVSAASKHPERALMVYDLLRNDKECYELINYGIEGKQFKRNSSGLREPVEGSKGIVTNYWWGRNDNLEVRDTATAWDVFDNINAIYDQCKIDYPFSQIVWDLSKISSELDAVTNIYGQYMGNICYGQNAEPEEYVKEFRQKLKEAGIEKVMKEFQQQLDSFYSKQAGGKNR
ncbi:ABC transporter substrate-binding protein [Treponema zioleckii]|uniref:ABC transporter substrate-binding protein n=1 Tax=Treponema zioleckii TaxID=331680 RepID=UPI00168ACED5|nr:ABC transporter substrate-binding protein [Treponema zioleckii]